MSILEAFAISTAVSDSVGDISLDLLQLPVGRFHTVLADPAWRFDNATGKVAPEHRRLRRYRTLPLKRILALPVERIMAPTAHLYLWCPNALLPDGLRVMAAWGFTYKSNLVWHKVRKDGGSDGRGVGFYFRNVTELLLFGVRGKNARTLAPGRRQVNLLATRKREHSRKPDEQYGIIEACSPGPYLELFARADAQADFPCRQQWTRLGDEAESELADLSGLALAKGAQASSCGGVSAVTATSSRSPPTNLPASVSASPAMARTRRSASPILPPQQHLRSSCRFGARHESPRSNRKTQTVCRRGCAQCCEVDAAGLSDSPRR